MGLMMEDQRSSQSGTSGPQWVDVPCRHMLGAGGPADAEADFLPLLQVVERRSIMYHSSKSLQTSDKALQYHDHPHPVEEWDQ
jgi:hypothetical protein